MTITVLVVYVALVLTDATVGSTVTRPAGTHLFSSGYDQPARSFIFTGVHTAHWGESGTPQLVNYFTTYPSLTHPDFITIS